MDDIKTLLQGALEARGRVLVKLNVGAADLDRVISLLPAMRSPTVAALRRRATPSGRRWCPRTPSTSWIGPELKDAGASDIIELPISKIVP